MSSLPMSISCQLFDADIQIPEEKLQAPFPFPPRRQSAQESLLTC